MEKLGIELFRDWFFQLTGIYETCVIDAARSYTLWVGITF